MIITIKEDPVKPYWHTDSPIVKFLNEVYPEQTVNGTPVWYFVRKCYTGDTGGAYKTPKVDLYVKDDEIALLLLLKYGDRHQA